MYSDSIHILVSFNTNYIPPFRTMLRSLTLNNPEEHFHVWLLHSAIEEKDLDLLNQYCSLQNVEFDAVKVDSELFKNAPVTKTYPEEMYYRLLAPLVLPEYLQRILYLDPDLLVLNDIRPLWELDLGSNTFAASWHSFVPDIVDDVNRFRLENDNEYFNTGVILMDLNKARLLINKETIFDYVQEHSIELLLPDQDVFNALYGQMTTPLDDRIYNYDPRYYSSYMVNSEGETTTAWIAENTVICHYCGKNKPWKKSYTNRFGLLYQHYMNQAERIYRQIPQPEEI